MSQTIRRPKVGKAHKDLPLDIDWARGEMCRRSFYYFVQTFWEEVIPAEPVWNWHIEYLCDKAQKLVLGVIGRGDQQKDLVINIPPGTTKSTIFSVMLPVWVWTIDPSMRILTVSYAYTLSIDLCIRSRDILKSKKFSVLFPDVTLKADQMGKSHYKNNAKGERMATSVGGSITGFHAHLIILDDPINAQEATSDSAREAAIDFIDRSLSTRKVSKEDTRTILVMQRLHTGDPTGHWLANRPDDVEHICLPGEATPRVTPKSLIPRYVKAGGFLDPVRMSDNVLRKLKLDLGTYGYSGQILQDPVPIDGAIWQPQYFKPIARHKIPELKKLGADWDLAYTKNEKNSASAYIIAGKHEENMYITGAGAFWAEFPVMIQKMRDLDIAPYVEAKASGKSAVQVLKKQGVPAIEVQIKGGGDKIARATLASPYAEAGLIFVAEDVLDYLLYDPRQGITRFPGGMNDDLNDALVQAINRLMSKPKVMIF